MTHKPTTSKNPLVPMPTEILDAAKLVYQAGVSEARAPAIFGINRYTFLKLLGDDGRGLYQSRIVARVRECFSQEALEKFIQAHNDLEKAKATYSSIASPTSENNNPL